MENLVLEAYKKEQFEKVDNPWRRLLTPLISTSFTIFCGYSE